MTTEEIRNARNSFAAQLTNMIRDFERQTGKQIRSINVEREGYKVRIPPSGVSDVGGIMSADIISLFKGVYIATE